MRSYWSFALLYAACAWIAWAVISRCRSHQEPAFGHLVSLVDVEGNHPPITLPESTEEFFELSAPPRSPRFLRYAAQPSTTRDAMGLPGCRRAGQRDPPPGLLPRIR